MATDAEILDERAKLIYANDPEVNFVDMAVDYNAPHGVNKESDKEGIT